jgi:Ca2+-transporting ATPase
MGITGTDVTKEASDMVLADDNFASIVAAVEEGRGIFSNIKKFVHFLLSCNTGEVATMLVASLARLPLPLLPIQILWTNLITDGLPALALGVDPPEPDIMKRPARKVQEGIISRNSLIRIGWQGLLIAGCTVAIYSYALFIEHRDLETARVLAFNVLVGTQLFHSFSCRSERHSLFKLGVFSNLRLVAAVVVSLGIQMALVFVPFLQPVFRTKAVPWQDWDLVMIVSTIPFWVTETVKAIGNLRRGARNA